MKTLQTTLFYFGLLFILGCGGCDGTYVANCDENATVLFPPLASDNPNDLPTGCADPDLENQVKLPAPDGDRIYLQFEHSGRRLQYRVFGIPDGGGAPEELLACQTTAHTFPLAEISVPPGRYENIVVGVGRDTLYNILNEETRDWNYAKLTAFERPPAEICGEPKRYIIGECSPNGYLRAWIAERGLNITDTLPFPWSPFNLIELPPGVDPNGVPVTVLDPMERDTANHFVEEDFTISLPNDDLNPTLGNLYFDKTNVDNVQELQPNQYFSPKDCQWLTYNRPPSTSFGASPTRLPGRYVDVAIIDSGADALLLNGDWSHNLGRLDRGGAVFLPPHPISGTNYYLGYDLFDGDGYPEDDLGHGTLVAGAFATGLTSEDRVNLLHYKIFDENGQATYFGAITAIYAAVLADVEVINLSWGISRSEAPEALKCAVEFARDEGVLIVTSAGNKDADIDAAPQWPAAFSANPAFWNVITVGSFVFKRPGFPVSRPIWSNYGTKTVDVSAYAAARTPSFPVKARPGNPPVLLDIHSGTSISAPVVARELARYLAGKLNASDRPTAAMVQDFLSTRATRRSDLQVATGANPAELPDFLLLPECAGGV